MPDGPGSIAVNGRKSHFASATRRGVASAPEAGAYFFLRIGFDSAWLRRHQRDPVTLLIWLLIGAVAGWLAGQIMKGGGFGLVGDIIVGIVGAALAGFLLPKIGIVIGGGLLGEIIIAVIDACLLIFLIRLIKRA